MQSLLFHTNNKSWRWLTRGLQLVFGLQDGLEVAFHYTRGCTLCCTSKSQGNNQPPCLGQAGRRIGDWRGKGDMNMASNLTDLFAVNIHAAIKIFEHGGPAASALVLGGIEVFNITILVGQISQLLQLS